MTPVAPTHLATAALVLGVASGLVAAISSAISYLISRHHVSEGGSSLRLLVLAHALMGVACLPVAWAVWPRGLPTASAWLVPLLGSSGCYLTGQAVVFAALARADASRVAPLLGLKIAMLACIVSCLPRPPLDARQWAAVALSVVAAAALQRGGGLRPIALGFTLAACVVFAISDLFIVGLIDGLQQTAVAAGISLERLEAGFLAMLVTYAFCGLLAATGLALVPGLRPTMRRDWIAGARYAAMWLLGMAGLYTCFGLVGVVFGNILQSTRGMMSIVFGAVLAHAGWHDLETKVDRRTFASRLVAAALMTAAIALYVVASATAADAADAPPTPRRLPPPGAALDDLVAQLGPRDQAAWQAVPERLVGLRKRLAALARDDDRADVEVLIKAVEFARAGGEWWQPSDLVHAPWAVDEAATRLHALEQDERPWRTARGLSVHGFRSAIDGSVQPYGLWIPDGLDLSKPVPLWIWLHGRGEKETDLHFLHQRAMKPPEFTPDDAIVLLPFGRYCNGWKGPGRVDVFEARDAVVAMHPIDADRVVLAGFSMGGAGAWQIGARRAGEFCAVHGGAGFVDTRRYTGVDPATLPAHEVRLWTTTDVPPVARNLLNLPAIAYSGERDRQRAASELMVETLAAENCPLRHVIGVGMAHRYDAASKQEITAFLQRAAADGRSRRAPRIHLATTTLADSRIGWVEAFGLGEHFAVARIDASRGEQESGIIITATTTNLTAVAFHDVVGVATVMIDGTSLDALGSSAGDPLVVAREGLRPEGGWRIAVAGELPPRRKRPGLTGPIDDAFTAPFVVVPPAGPGIDPLVDRFVIAEFDHFRQRWHDLFRGELPVVGATDLTDEMVRDRHLVLFGDPISNPVIARVLPDLPLRWTREEIFVAGRSHLASRHVPVMIQPNPLCPPTARSAGRYVVLNSGVTFREEADASNAWQNPRLPDWAIVDLAPPSDGRTPGQLAAAGFCDEFWRITAARPQAR